jgi:NADPH:quinone reductase-like Zn-dependent oxidoreductase
MAKAIRLRKVGGPEVLELETVEVGEPGAGEVRVRHTYVAVNFIDIYHRTGRYPLSVRSKNRNGREAGALCRGGKVVPEALWYNFADSE